MPGDLSQDVHLDGLPLGTRGGIVVRHTFPLDAEYDLQVAQGGGGAPGRAAAAAGRAPTICTSRSMVCASTLQGRGATRIRVPAGPHTLAAAPVVRTRTAGADGIFHIERARPASRRSSSVARSTRPARATRRAGGVC